MEIDSSTNPRLKPRDRILLRLSKIGVPKERIEQGERGLVVYLKENKSKLNEVVLHGVLPSDEEVIEMIVGYKLKENQSKLNEVVLHGVLPSDEEVIEMIVDSKVESGEGAKRGCKLKEQFKECIDWLRWLMFEDEPRKCLENLGKLSLGQRGVCGAVWGHNDIAYWCKTCENDPTCAICVTCFQNGDHKDHDYSLMYTGGGCCDCGDETAWKQNGFCSKHKGAEQIQPLHEEIACTVGPVLDVLFGYWEEKLLLAQAAYLSKTLNGGDHVKVENSLTSNVVEMLLEFCKHSESLLSFISRRIFSSVPLLDVLVRGERFLNKAITTKLHELLLKLLGDPVFKYEFAKVFIIYYPDIIKESIKEGSDSVLEKYKLVDTFSVQIFTVPTLTPRLVKEMNLLGILFGCLEDMFSSCAGEEGHIQVSKWASLYETTVRLVEDTRFVLNHTDVARYVTHEQPDISKTWMRLLAFVQGMNPQKRVTGLHVEEENENMHIPFFLGHSIANIHSLLVNGAFSVDQMKENSNLQDMDEDDGDSLLSHVKVGRLSQQSSVCSTAGRSTTMDGTSQVAEECFYIGNGVSVPCTVTWLACECLQAIENWLGFNALQMEPHSSLSQDISRGAVANFLYFKKTFSRIAKPKSISKVIRSSSARGRFSTSSEILSRHNFLSSSGNFADKRGYSLVVTKETDVSARSSSSGLSKDTVEAECSESEALGLLSSSDWPNIVYDVSSEDISVHIPLHRLLSLVLLKALKNCYGETGGSEISSPNSACLLQSGHYHDFFGKMLLGWHPVGFSAFVMEHPLRIKVFCAQVRAGMWRKNGDVAMLSCEWYRSVRWSEQGLELDIFLLQCCAALAPPDLFVKRILERFGLSSYLSLNPEQSNEHEPVLLQEMLTLIIQIVKERRFCGLSTAESLRRELVYKLSIGDVTRSQLVKSLPQDLSKNDQLQMILDSVADYSNPSGMKQGKYLLRKSCWEELDLYHPRWNSRDLQVAEERYLRFCKVSALAGQLPRWTKVFDPLNGISRIATSKALLEIIRAILYYALLKDKRSHTRAPDGVVLIALHLLSLGLDICYVQRQSSGQEEDPFPLVALASEEISGGPSVGSDAVKQKTLLSLLVSTMRMYKNSTFEVGQCDISALIANILKKFADLSVCCAIELQILAPEVVPHLTLHPSPNSNLSTQSSSSDAEERKLKARARQAAIMEKMKAAQSKFMESLASEENVEAEVCRHLSEDSTPIICSLCRDPDSKSPLSFLVLLQKSRLASFVERVQPVWGKPDREYLSATTGEITEPHKRLQSGSEATSASNIEQLVQNAINEFSHNGLPVEVEDMVDFIKAQLDCTINLQRPSTSYGTSMDTSPSSIEMMEVGIYQSVVNEMQNAVYANQKFSTEHDKKDLTEKRLAQCTVLGKYMASLSREKLEKSPASKSSRSENASSRISGGLPAYDGFGPTDTDGIHISSCGHAVHHECRSRYLSSLRERYIRRIIFEGGHVVDPDQGEFLCPLCRRLANSVLPAVSNNFSNLRKEILAANSGAGPITGSLVTSGINVFRLSLSLTLLQSTSNCIEESRMHITTLDRNKKMQPTLEPILNILSRMYYPDKHEKFLASGRVSHSMVLWDTLKYSLISTEIAARGVGSNMRSGSEPSTSGLEVLYRELESSSGFILSLLLQVAQNARKENLLQVLLRYRGINLFAASICSGVSLDDESSPAAVKGIGDISSVLKHVDKGVVYPDIQFWGRTADPVLSRDPFSSLMWILFCLPSPFLSSEDCFLCLVHLFYAVSVIQVLVTYIGKHPTVIAELGLSDCLISDLCKNVGGTFAKFYFASNYMDEASCQLKDMIRRMSYPYLRRCALLWKLLKSCTPEPFSDRSHERNRVSSNLNDNALESSLNDLPIELKEIEELEQKFQIPDLDVVFKDKTLRMLGVKWFNHFSREFDSRNYGRVLHTTPAVPFRLMRLPRLYQDLLEKYIKQKCPECEAAQDDPALCLLCGRICSPSWKPCCSESGCQSHAMACGAGIGVYLLIRRTTILLQRSARQAPWPSPYLDAFGEEEDIERHRGKPLYLNEERYATLTNMVASHGLDRSSDVLRQTTIDGLFMI